MAERSNAAVLKTVVRLRGPGVRIPPSPPLWNVSNMKIFFLLPIVFFIMQTSNANNNLSDFIWKNRILLIIIEKENKNEVDQYKKLLSQLSCEINDRDLLIGWFTDKSNMIANSTINPENIKKIKSRIKPNQSGDNILLIGKDGGIKRSYKSLPNIYEVFSIIDRMPMRRSEMKKNSEVCT